MKDTTVKVECWFQTRLLWCADDVVLPASSSMALNRLKGMERQMKRLPEVGKAIKSIMEDCVKSVFTEIVAK